MLKDFDIQNILNQRINRRDFLRYAGVLLLSIFGVTNLLASLTNNVKPVKPQPEVSLEKGFGGGKYGT